MTEWTFLTNHAIVLSFLAKHPRITARELSTAIGITERAVRRFIADLHAAGYITKKREGRGVRYRINPNLPLRHDTYREIVIGDFLESLGWKRGKEKNLTRVRGRRQKHNLPGTAALVTPLNKGGAGGVEAGKNWKAISSQGI